MDSGTSGHRNERQTLPEHPAPILPLYALRLVYHRVKNNSTPPHTHTHKQPHPLQFLENRIKSTRGIHIHVSENQITCTHTQIHPSFPLLLTLRKQKKILMAHSSTSLLEKLIYRNLNLEKIIKKQIANSSKGKKNCFR